MKTSITNMMIIISVMVFSTLIVQAAPPRFAVIYIGDFGGTNGSDSDGINQNGEIVGSSFLVNNKFHAMRWINGEMIDLNSDLTGNSFAFKNNDVGQIVGEAEFEGQFLKNRAFLWENGQMFDLGTLGGKNSEAHAINNFGQVVGDSNFDPTKGVYQPFIWEQGQMRPLLSPDCVDCTGDANDINDNGIIVGNVNTPTIINHAVMWDLDGIIHDIGALRETDVSGAKGINDLGQIVGINISGGTDDAVLWDKGNIFNLTLNHSGSTDAWANAINNNGLIVGVVTEGRNHGALWDSKHNEHNLSYMIAPLNKWWIGDAYDINDNNQIAANASIRQERGPFSNFGVVLTPVKPVFELVDPEPGVAGALNTITARGGKLKAGSVVSFYWGLQGGGTLLPNCNMLDAVLQIENARFAGSAVVDDNGVATLEGMIPAGAQGRYVLLQAVTGPNSPTGCAQSQLVVVKFQ